MKKLFGSITLTWTKLIVFAVVAGVYTGIMALLPITRDTSFADISISFEWWVLFGILIIVNSKTPLDSALKCFVFFLISQPLVYLVQVPFSERGWELFVYYPPWFVWTLLTIPMGFVGYYMRKEKWWSLLILVPMLVFVGYHYMGFLNEAVSFFPNHLLSTVFCAATVIIYPLFIFKKKKLKMAGLIISIAILLAGTALALASGRQVYNTTVLVNSGGLHVTFDDTYTVYLEDESYGEVFIVYEESIEDYMVNAAFTKTGATKLILVSPDGERRTFDLVIERYSYDIEESGNAGQ
ncbi:MAG: hypothetical protein J5482_01665 [Oscillospiraceae bacterium]|nr:hypothetical protein [Oscillospiraceae bacterium]